MSTRLTQRVDQINIEYTDKPVLLDILYSGMFVGEVYGNCIARFNRSRLIIISLDDAIPEVLMSYEGGLEIKKISSYNVKGSRLPSSVTVVDDTVSNSASEIRYVDQTPKELNQTVKYYKKTEVSLLYYKYNDDEIYVTNKGKELNFEKLSIYEKGLYNKIRGRNA